MKRLLLAVLSVLCLCGCENTKDREDVNVVAKKDMTSVCEEEIKGFSVLGIQMGSDIGCVRRVLAKRVDDVWTDEAIIIKGQQVGPTRFHEIKFEFESFRGKSALKEIEMYAELDKEEARYFTYFWNKEFESKYECRCKTLGRVIECHNLYHINDSTTVSVDVEKSYYGYKGIINYLNWNAGNKIFDGIDDKWLDNYFKEADEDRCIFTEY